eukprot:CAMPEP_0167809480 /NCGR_PEP_ID=MMETSP0111_2-20121227/23821_1 /TAXON_ID=91324 /ORGANISM="Lotharella globosa, Strain CCCM811" /LENGTH=35 /DNA_ID= /DNA_START= /DNA_END= /DNA_ORIENTATION=
MTYDDDDDDDTHELVVNVGWDDECDGPLKMYIETA